MDINRVKRTQFYFKKMEADEKIREKTNNLMEFIDEKIIETKDNIEFVESFRQAEKKFDDKLTRLREELETLEVIKGKISEIFIDCVFSIPEYLVIPREERCRIRRLKELMKDK